MLVGRLWFLDGPFRHHSSHLLRIELIERSGSNFVVVLRRRLMPRIEVDWTNLALSTLVPLPLHCVKTHLRIAPFVRVRTIFVLILNYLPGVPTFGLLRRHDRSVLLARASVASLADCVHVIGKLTFVRHAFLRTPLIFIDTLPYWVSVLLEIERLTQAYACAISYSFFYTR